MPVTSLNVATNGALDAAGSNPRRFISNGNIEPAIVPAITMPMSDKPITVATIHVDSG